jgi:hypothetical protein
MNKIRLVVEGPDGSGKSTAIATYQRAFQHKYGEPLRVFHLCSMFGGIPKDVSDYALRVQVMANAARPCVFDRSPFISELVYGPILRGGTVVPIASLQADISCCFTGDSDLHQLFTTYLLYCRPSTEILLDHAVKSRQHKDEAHCAGIKAHQLELIEAYDNIVLTIASMFPKRVLCYDYAQGDVFPEIF